VNFSFFLNAVCAITALARKLGCRRQTARRIYANTMLWLTSWKHAPSHLYCDTMPNLVVLR